MTNPSQEDAITNLVGEIMTPAMNSIMHENGVNWENALLALGLVARGIAELSQKLTDTLLSSQLLQEKTVGLLLQGMTQVCVQINTISDEDDTPNHVEITHFTQPPSSKVH